MFSIVINPVVKHYCTILLSQLIPGVGRCVVDIRTHRYHAGGVDGVVRGVVMALDVNKVHRGCNTGQLVEVAHITRQVLVVLQALAIAI